MRLPKIHGLIRRRLLLNFRVDPKVIQRQLPSPFRPKLQDGNAIAGVCLIRLEHIRPKPLPALFGISSENAAHRIAVLWDDEAGPHEGVYIPRRDTTSILNRIAGGRIFPGEHHPARFQVEETGDHIELQLESADHKVKVEVAANLSTKLPGASCFHSLSEASRFFESGSLGYSATSDGHRLDGIILQTHDWKVQPLE